MDKINSFFESVDLKIKTILEQSVFLKEGEDTLKKVGAYLCLESKSKKIRSNIAYCFGTEMHIKQEDMISIATGAELIHVASLLHDDVIDYGLTRRGKPTANALHGNTIAVLAGDFLYTTALESIQHLPTQVFYEAIQVVKKMTISASFEYHVRGKKITIHDWENIATGKTACLFSWCAKIPAMLQNNNKAQINFDKSADLVGKSFQLADDIKDFFASETFGKELYSDIKNKNPNYVAISAMNESQEIEKLITNLWNTMDTLPEETINKIVQNIGVQIYDSKSFRNSVEQLNTWIDQAIEILNKSGYKNLGNNIEILIDKVYHSLDPLITQHIS